MSAEILIVGLEVARIGVDLLTGKRDDAATATRDIAGLLVRIIPVAQLREYLDDFDRLAIDVAADIEEERVLNERKDRSP